MSSKTKKDISDELHSLIFDMLDERCGDIVPEEHDIRVVLTELGTPSELADKYNLTNGKCLIGQPYYTKYLFVLKIVLLAVIFGLTLSSIITFMIEPMTHSVPMISTASESASVPGTETFIIDGGDGHTAIFLAGKAQTSWYMRIFQYIGMLFQHSLLRLPLLPSYLHSFIIRAYRLSCRMIRSIIYLRYLLKKRQFHLRNLFSV